MYILYWTKAYTIALSLVRNSTSSKLEHFMCKSEIAQNSSAVYLYNQ